MVGRNTARFLSVPQYLLSSSLGPSANPLIREIRPSSMPTSSRSRHSFGEDEYYWSLSVELVLSTVAAALATAARADG